MARSERANIEKEKVWSSLNDAVGWLYKQRYRRDWRVNSEHTISLFVTYSKLHEYHDWYWYGIKDDDLNSWLDFDLSLVVFILGDASKILILPVQLLKYHIDEENVSYAESDYSYKLNIRRKGINFLQLPKLDTTPYLNNYSLLEHSKSEENITAPALDIDDLPENSRVLQNTYRILRDTALSRTIKSLYDYHCQLCGETVQLFDKNYAEAHHIKPLGKPHNGPDIGENILCVCPNHHVLLDYGAIELNKALIRTQSGHSISDKFIAYHNSQILKT